MCVCGRGEGRERCVRRERGSGAEGEMCKKGREKRCRK